MVRQSSYGAELEQIERDLAALEGPALAPPVGGEEAAKYVYRLYHRATLTGDLTRLRHVLTAIERALYHLGPAEDICLLKANVHFAMHQLREARHALEMAPLLPQRLQARALLADLDYEDGRYEDAGRAYERLVADSRTWDNLARLAKFCGIMGDSEHADRLYADAEEELTAKETRSFSWVELQRGVLDQMHGRFDLTLTHYERADRAYSGHWLVKQHLADLLAAEGQLDAAAVLYEGILTEVPRPDLREKLGRIFCSLGRMEAAENCFDQALSEYLASVEQGEVHYFHHLAEFFVESRKDWQRAAKWAREDLRLRNNYATQAAVAWTDYCSGQLERASLLISRALSSGVVDLGLFAKAAEIYHAAGQHHNAHELERRASAINPFYQRVHMSH